MCWNRQTVAQHRRRRVLYRRSTLYILPFPIVRSARAPQHRRSSCMSSIISKTFAGPCVRLRADQTGRLVPDRIRQPGKLHRALSGTRVARVRAAQRTAGFLASRPAGVACGLRVRVAFKRSSREAPGADHAAARVDGTTWALFEKTRRRRRKKTPRGVP
jgi:hypothetical protein